MGSRVSLRKSHVGHTQGHRTSGKSRIRMWIFELRRRIWGVTSTVCFAAHPRQLGYEGLRIGGARFWLLPRDARFSRFVSPSRRYQERVYRLGQHNGRLPPSMFTTVMTRQNTALPAPGGPCKELNPRPTPGLPSCCPSRITTLWCALGFSLVQAFGGDLPFQQLLSLR